MYDDADLLYLAATLISLALIATAMAFRFCCGSKKKKLLADGRFGFPVAEWKKHKVALDKEYSESCEKDRMEQYQVNASLTKKPSEDNEQYDEFEQAYIQRKEEEEEVSTEEEDCVDDDGTSGDNEHPKWFDVNEKGGLKKRLDEDDLEHLPGKLKSIKFRKATEQLEAQLTHEQIEQEVEIRNRQIESILSLLKEQEGDSGLTSTEDLAEQLKLYNL